MPPTSAWPASSRPPSPPAGLAGLRHRRRPPERGRREYRGERDRLTEREREEIIEREREKKGEREIGRRERF